MSALPSAPVAHESANCAVSAKMLRQWCTPHVILVVTNLTDELVILPHAIRQARQSGATVILANAVTPSETASRGPKSSSDSSVPQIHEARSILDRMARQLRWLGIASEPLVLIGHPEVELPLAARSCCADRVILRFDDKPDPSQARSRVFEQLLANIDVPTCVIGRNVSVASPSSRLTRKITLAVSSISDCDIPLSFACWLAHELRAKLTILHVFGDTERDLDRCARTPAFDASRLPILAWRPAELVYPTEIKVREGSASEEILRYAISTNQDLILLCSAGGPPTGQHWRTTAGYGVLAGAECPVFVVRKQSEMVTNVHMLCPQKILPYDESIRSKEKDMR
jgi:nucleotide-binding universal stress UspA family protein